MGASRSKRLPHFLLGGDFFSLLANLDRYGGCEPKKLMKVAGLACFSALTAPVRMYESVRYSAQIRKTELHPQPIFVFGHWQCGASLLQFLLARDPQFGYLNTLAAMFPRSYLCSRWLLKPIIKRAARGKDRGADSLALSIEMPQGDDWPIALSSDLSTYHTYTFPQHAERIFSRGIMLEGLSARELEAWKRLRLRMMQKRAFDQGKPRLMLRSGADTARIRQLLEMFPQARFIHVVRHPFQIASGTIDRWESMCRIWSFQRFDMPRLRQLTIDFYERLMRRYFADRKLIPEGNLVEVRYEELLADPHSALRHLYSSLSLDGFESAWPGIADYLSKQTGSMGGNDDTLTSVEREQIRSRLEFVFTETGYEIT